jgi:hypothetical protein
MKGAMSGTTPARNSIDDFFEKNELILIADRSFFGDNDTYRLDKDMFCTYLSSTSRSCYYDGNKLYLLREVSETIN